MSHLDALHLLDPRPFFADVNNDNNCAKADLHIQGGGGNPDNPYQAPPRLGYLVLHPRVATHRFLRLLLERLRHPLREDLWPPRPEEHILNAVMGGFVKEAALPGVERVASDHEFQFVETLHGYQRAGDAAGQRRVLSQCVTHNAPLPPLNLSAAQFANKALRGAGVVFV